MRKARDRKAGGTPITEPPVTVSEAEARLRVRSMMPIQLDYDPFSSSENLKRLIADLTKWVLEGKLFHRQAGAVRSLVQQWIRVDEHQRVDAIEARLTELEKMKQR